MKTAQSKETQRATLAYWTEIVARFATPVTQGEVRRAEPRFGAGGSAELVFRAPATVSGKLLDAAIGGVSVGCTDPVPPNTPVAVKLSFGDHNVVVFGVVRHCTPTFGIRNTYKVGITLSFHEKLGGC